MKDYKNILFPFSAVHGQPLFKLALLLASVNPALGGVLISGPRGSAKSTLSRGVAELLPENEELTPQFVTLPLGASEEMLIGTLDLESVLKDKSLRFSPGLLKKAHGGVLYVDEVNLLPDHLVDQLLDVASSGVNTVERDGISHRHEARFTLIGTMNPDEGELRPQLQDRFGLMVELDNTYSIEDRLNIIKSRQSFEDNHDAFCDAHQPKQQLLQQQIINAQALLSKVLCSDECLIDIDTRCQQANVEGLRADIIMHRASLTHAAWCGRTEVTQQDIEQVAPLVLLHRQQVGGTPPNSQAPPQKPENNSDNRSEKPNSGFSRPKPPAEQSKQDHESSAQGNERSADNENNDDNVSGDNLGEWGAMPAQSGEAQKITQSSPALKPLSDFAIKNIKQQFNHDVTNKRAGKKNRGGQTSHLNSAQPDWFSTLSKSLGQWPPTQLAFKKITTGEQRLHLILLDTSASTLTDSLSAIAKSVVMGISDNAYLQRDKISLLGFGNDNVETIIKAGRAPKQIDSLLNNICALGGTPLRLALQKASKTIKQLTLQYPNLALCCYLITDGRSRADLSDLKLNLPTLLIDIEKSQIKRGRGKLLAEQLNAQYVALAV